MKNWSYARTDAGWDVKNENGVVVTSVVDPTHERVEVARALIGCVDKALARAGRFAERTPDGSWFHERTNAGWDVLDENRLLVAHVPDAAHEREDDAVQIVSSARRADH